MEHYEFSETNLHSMNQLNALAQVGFMVTLFNACVVASGAGNHLVDHRGGGKPAVCQELATLRHLQVTL